MLGFFMTTINTIVVPFAVNLIFGQRAFTLTALGIGSRFITLTFDHTGSKLQFITFAQNCTFKDIPKKSGHEITLDNAVVM
jgi:hypothetical protein